ncbi:hypothetical protein PoB_001191900 [Plakobranchus ocellatus]|uniref:Uncharacterized protein n=1 Tax=Plakobranchus ocellatus TaxID=259542 RepID=A0AAV3YTP3_9GAST|nr:hypothetical protein PoB_001191900 [Plakobranchus ocellatus]
MKPVHLMFVLATGLAIVNGQLVTNTSGEAGELCGLHHRCLSISYCNKSIGNYECLCPDDLVGNGKLGCVRNVSNTVFIQSDPHVKNLYHEFLTVGTPCRYRVMEYIYNDRFWAKVYADNFLYHGGKYFVNRIEMKAGVSKEPLSEIPDSSKLTWLSVLIEGNTTSEGHYQFKEWRKNESISWTTPNENTRFLQDGSEIVTHYDDVNNMAIILAYDVGLKISFRPADIFALESSKRMPLVPGAVITVDDGELAKTQFSETDISSTPDGPSVKRLAVELNVTLNIFAIFLTLNNYRVNEATSDNQECDAVVRDFGNMCTYIQDEFDAVKRCGHLYLDQELLVCVQSKYLSEEFLPLAFKLCIQATCGKNSPSCHKLKKHITDVGCDLPKPIEELNCGTDVQLLLKSVENNAQVECPA